MDEFTRIRDLLPEPEPAHATEIAAARRTVLGAPARTSGPATTSGPARTAAARTAGRRLKIGAALTTAAAGAVAAALVATAGGPAAVTADPPPVGPASAGPAPGGRAPLGGSGSNALSAHTLLLTAATAAGHAPATGRYWNVSTRSGAQIVTPGGYLIEQRYSEQLWQPTAAGTPTWRVIQNLGAGPVTAADRTAWIRDGRPTYWTIPPRRLSPAEQRAADEKARIAGPHYRKPAPERIAAAAETPFAAPEDNHGAAGYLAGKPRTLADLAALPADPAALTGWLRTQLAALGYPPTPTDLFLEAVHIALYLPVSPAVRAAGYRLLADLPGVRLVGTVRDPLGRTGEAIALAQRDYDWRLVLDTATGTPLALETVATSPHPGDAHQARAGQLISYDAVLAAGWTDASPTLPSRRATPVG
jgi:hypothetical protein